MHIMIVDDDPADRFLIRFALEDKIADVHIDEIDCGKRALDFLSLEDTVAPDVLIIDMNMPHMTGIDVLSYLAADEYLRNKLANTAFFVLSGGLTNSMMEALSRLSVAPLIKPLTPAAIEQVRASAKGSHRVRPQTTLASEPLVAKSAPANTDMAASADAPPTVVRSDSASSPIVIFLVDDSEPDRFLSRHELESAGQFVTIIECSNGPRFLAELQHPRWRRSDQQVCVLLDINMPSLDGFEVLDQIRKVPDLHDWARGKGALAMLTSSNDPDDRRRAESYGYDIGFITKPLTTESVTQLLSRVAS